MTIIESEFLEYLKGDGFERMEDRLEYSLEQNSRKRVFVSYGGSDGQVFNVTAESRNEVDLRGRPYSQAANLLVERLKIPLRQDGKGFFKMIPCSEMRDLDLDAVAIIIERVISASGGIEKVIKAQERASLDIVNKHLDIRR